MVVKRAGGGVTVSDEREVVRMSPCEVRGSLGSPVEVRLIMLDEELVGVEVDIKFPCKVKESRNTPLFRA